MSKQWQLRRGTTAENNGFTGAQGELTMDTDTNALRIHDGTTQGGHMIDCVVAWQAPTAENNYTWYRKYASGWVEQGGKATSNGGQVISIALPVEMADTNYWGFATLEQASTSNVCGQKYTENYSTTTTFVTFLQQGSGKWFVCGMAAA